MRTKNDVEQKFKVLRKTEKEIYQNMKRKSDLHKIEKNTEYLYCISDMINDFHIHEAHDDHAAAITTFFKLQHFQLLYMISIDICPII